jgi:hypothetical protein
MKTRHAISLIGCALAGLLAGCTGKKQEGGGDGLKALVITAIPDEKVSDQEAKFQALKEYLAEELDIPVEFSISSDYKAAVQRFANGEVHLAWFGGLTGVQARDRVAGARAIAQGEADPNFKSYFIAHASTGLTKSDEFPAEGLKDLTFTFGERTTSTSWTWPPRDSRSGSRRPPSRGSPRRAERSGHALAGRPVGPEPGTRSRSRPGFTTTPSTRCPPTPSDRCILAATVPPNAPAVRLTDVARRRRSRELPQDGIGAAPRGGRRAQAPPPPPPGIAFSPERRRRVMVGVLIASNPPR